MCVHCTDCIRAEWISRGSFYLAKLTGSDSMPQCSVSNLQVTLKSTVQISREIAFHLRTINVKNVPTSIPSALSCLAAVIFLLKQQLEVQLKEVNATATTFKNFIINLKRSKFWKWRENFSPNEKITSCIIGTRQESLKYDEIFSLGKNPFAK